MTDQGCESCPMIGAIERREFLRNTIARALLGAGVVGVVSSRAMALSATFTRGIGIRPDKSYPIPAADGVQIDRDESLIVARFDGRAWVFSLACPHQNTAIHWEASDHRFQCPKHKSRYRPDGTFIEGRATRGLDRFAVRREGDQLLVNLDALYREDKDATEWSTAFVDLIAREK